MPTKPQRGPTHFDPGRDPLNDRSSSIPECTGACCAVFTFPPEMIQGMRDRQGEEDAFILGMLIDLTPEQIAARLRALNFCGDGDYGADYARWAWEEDGYGTKWLAFTCRH